VDSLRGELEKLEAEVASPDFWQGGDQQGTISRLKDIKGTVSAFDEVEAAAEDVSVLLELAEEEAGEDALREVEAELGDLRAKVERLQLLTYLRGPNDASDIYLSLHAGAGGTDACDWVEMLLRMYSRWMDRNGYKYRMLDWLPGDEAGLKSVTLEVTGDHPYGYLQGEMGVHRLVRISPFDANRRRHTSFAAADVVAKVTDEKEVEINDSDIRVDYFKASGPGGQKVNKTSSAVRIVHIPTGIIVQCQNERSQHQNRRVATEMLQSRLLQLKRKEREEELQAAYDARGQIAWGNQIRSYVLQPYTLVKDHRTDEQTGKVQAVLDGEIDAFIEAYLRSKASQQRRKGG